MTMRKFALGGVAATAILISGAALAQDPYATNPTPSERQQTNQLNRQADQQATGEADQQNASQAQYDQQQEKYQDQRARYSAQQQHYQEQRARYENERDHYVREHWPTRYNYDRFAIYTVPDHDLMDRTVTVVSGAQVGRIRSVDRAPDGRVMRVRIGLDRGRAAWVDARDIRYDAADGVVLVDLSRHDLYDMSRFPA